jgi:hypothetical protein
MQNSNFVDIMIGDEWHNVEPSIANFQTQQAQTGKLYSSITDLITDWKSAGKPGFQLPLFIHTYYRSV